MLGPYAAMEGWVQGLTQHAMSGSAMYVDCVQPQLGCMSVLASGYMMSSAFDAQDGLCLLLQVTWILTYSALH